MKIHRLFFLLAIVNSSIFCAVDNPSISVFNQVSDARIGAYQKEMTGLLNRRQKLHTGAMAVMNMLTFYGMYDTLYKSVGAVLCVYQWLSNESLMTAATGLAMGAIDPNKELQSESSNALFWCKVLGCMIVQKSAHKYLKNALSWYAPEQTLALYLEQQNPYFFHIHVVQLSAQMLEQRDGDATVTHHFTQSCNMLVDRTEHLIAYMQYRASSVSSKKMQSSDVDAVCASLKNGVNEFVNQAQRLLVRNGLHSLAQRIRALRDQVTLLCTQFAHSEDSVCSLQEYVFSMNNHLVYAAE